MPTRETTITVEQALAELREMCPGSCPHIDYNDYTPIGGALVVSVSAGGLQLGTAASLGVAMRQARDWKESQQ